MTARAIARIFVCSTLSALVYSSSSSSFSAYAQVNESGSARFRRATEIKLNDEAPRRNMGPPTLKDLFPQMTISTSVPQPLSLDGMKLDGIGAKSGKMLGTNHFVVLQGSAENSMAAVYAENRSDNKSNFVTADPFVHAYFAINNAIAFKVVNETLYGELHTLLQDLISSCVKDYRACEIDEVKDDIQRNLAYVIVGLKLLDPKIVLADMGGASDLAREELENISRGGMARSIIFNRDEDFSALAPLGFYSRSEKSSNYYRSAAWLSRMYLSLSDVTNNSQTGGGNNFRRALLLYRALELGHSSASVSAGSTSSPPTLMSSWQRVYDISLCLSQSGLTREQTVYPRDMKNMFQAGNLEFRNLLQALAQPFSRARLLLSIKKQKPQGLDAASIFELDKARSAEENMMVMRFLPPLNSYELEWLKTQTGDFKEEGEEGGYHSPLSLFVLYSWGSPLASNILHDMTDRLNPALMNTLPELTRVAGRRRIEADANSPACVSDKRWAVITEYFRPLKKNTQSCLLSEYWSAQHLLSASAAYIDSFTAFDAPSPLKAVVVEKAVVPAAVEISRNEMSAAARMFAPKQQAVKHASNFHYLEPMPDIYRKLGAFITITENDLNRLRCFPADMRGRAADYVRLLDRLAKISEQELAVQPISSLDFKLLANIDSVLAAIGSPVSGSLYLPGTGSGGKFGAASVGPGDPGVVNAIFSTDQGAYLSRGSLYTYYEISGGPFKQVHWDRKKGFGFLRPPGWIAKCDILTDATKPAAPSGASSSNVSGSGAASSNASSAASGGAGASKSEKVKSVDLGNKEK